jgi:hypothetical protein
VQRVEVIVLFVISARPDGGLLPAPGNLHILIAEASPGRDFHEQRTSTPIG